MGIQPFTDRDLGDLALLIQHDPPLGQIQIERITSGPRLRQAFPGGPKIAEVFVGITLVDTRLRLFIGDHFGDADDGAGETP